MSRLVAVVPSLGSSPVEAEMLASLRRELARSPEESETAELVWVQQGSASPPALQAPRERLLRLEHPVGFAAAVNAGYADRSGCDFIAVLNDDVVLDPGWLPPLLAELESRHGCAAVQGVNLDLAAPSKVDGCGLGWNRDWQAVQVGHGDAPLAPNAPPFELFGVSATAAVYRASAIRAVASADAPFFDARLGSYYEDVELAVRLREAGWESWCVPAARARHAGQATSRRFPRARWRLLYRNRWLVAARLLGDRFGAERGRMHARDRRDLVRHALRLDRHAVLGLLAGRREAMRTLAMAGGTAGEPLSAPRALAAAERLAVGSRA